MEKTIGERIKQRRKEIKMTQEELAKRLNYTSKSTINKIEKNVNDIPLSKLDDFIKALETTGAYLLGWSELSNKFSDNPEISNLQNEIIKLTTEINDVQEISEICDITKIKHTKIIK